MTAEEYREAHGDTFVEWLRDNTVECACEHKYGSDETKRRGDVIDVQTEITCRRCFVPIGLHPVSLRAPIPGPAPPAPLPAYHPPKRQVKHPVQPIKTGRSPRASFDIYHEGTST